MSKPSWDYAPEWASWMALDDCGIWCWYEKKPCYKKRRGVWVVRDSRWVAASYNGSRDSLEKRP